MAGPKKKAFSYNSALRLVFWVLILFFIVYLVQTQFNIKSMRAELTAMQAQVEQQRLVNKDLELTLREDSNYLERAAREKLDYAHPEEQVFVETSGT